MPSDRALLRIEVGEPEGAVSALLNRPEAPTALFVLAHGAGAGMTHPFMEGLAIRLAQRGVATLRFQFPYTERGSRRPDPKPRLLRTIRAALATARASLPECPLFAGGKSMGGRMTSLLQAAEPQTDVRGLIYVGFPLHPAGKKGVDRADHLPQIAAPMLFIQGTRDKLASMPLMTQVLRGLPSTAQMHIVDGADHGFHVLKRSGRTPAAVDAELVDTIVTFIDGVTAGS